MAGTVTSLASVKVKEGSDVRQWSFVSDALTVGLEVAHVYEISASGSQVVALGGLAGETAKRLVAIHSTGNVKVIHGSSTTTEEGWCLPADGSVMGMVSNTSTVTLLNLSGSAAATVTIRVWEVS